MSKLVIQVVNDKDLNRLGGYSCRIIRQTEVRRDPQSRMLVLLEGEVAGIRIVSDGSPDFWQNPVGVPEFYTRGVRPDLDDRSFIVATDCWDKFKKTILAYNKLKGNNKHVEMEDVVWECSH